MSAAVIHLVPMEQMPNRIRELRLQAGWSQEKLAEAIGATKMTVSSLERGAIRLDTVHMRNISSALGVAPADLLPREDNPDALSIEERQLLMRLRELDPEAREQFGRVAEAIMPFRHAPQDRRAG